MIDKYEILALRNIKGVGSKAISKIMACLDDFGAVTLLDIDLKLLIHNPSLSQFKKVLEAGLSRDYLEDAIFHSRQDIDKWETLGVTVIPINSALYPEPLRLIRSPPELIFCKGNITLLSQHKNVAIIGTRQNTPLGKAIAAKTTQFLVSSGYCVVSGLALGIDAISHEACLKCDGQTIAVLVDVDNVQPNKNRDLAARILTNGGLLIAENPPGIPITPPLFIKRDRIQTGLSLAVFPIETALDGGTMHAVKAAKQENRLIYVPDHNKSGYPDKSIKQIEGIIYLSKDPDIESYTKDSYTNIIKQLDEKEAELLNVGRLQGTFL